MPGARCPPEAAGSGTRIHVSLRYLNDPHIPVKDIIPQVGIYDMNYYSRLFKKYIGMSPTEYRKRLREGDTQAPYA